MKDMYLSDLDRPAAESKETVLHVAVKNRDLFLVGLLLKRYANVNARDIRGNTPVHVAAAAGNMDMVKLLAKDKRADLKIKN